MRFTIAICLDVALLFTVVALTQTKPTLAPTKEKMVPVADPTLEPEPEFTLEDKAKPARPAMAMPGPVNQPKINPTPPKPRYHYPVGQIQACYQVDVVLAKYAGHYVPDPREAEVARNALRCLNCPRVVTYPASYVPVLVPKEDIPRIRALLGENRFLEISPKLR